MFDQAVQLVICARGGLHPGVFQDLQKMQRRFYSIQHLDFTRGETHKALVFSGPTSAFQSLDHFVACGIDTVLNELGYEHNEPPEEALEELSRLHFEPAQGVRVRSLAEHLFSKEIGHDLSYYDHPNVTLVATVSSWIFPASGACVLTSERFYFMSYWFCTG